MYVKKLAKLTFVIIVIAFFIGCLNTNTIYAKTINTDIVIYAMEGNGFASLGNSILSTVYVIGIFASVAALMIKGIKFMTGSVEEKSDQKKVLIYYLIGTILVISIPQVVKLIYDFAVNLF